MPTSPFFSFPWNDIYWVCCKSQAQCTFWGSRGKQDSHRPRGADSLAKKADTNRSEIKHDWFSESHIQHTQWSSRSTVDRVSSTVDNLMDSCPMDYFSLPSTRVYELSINFIPAYRWRNRVPERLSKPKGSQLTSRGLRVWTQAVWFQTLPLGLFNSASC